MQGSGKCIGPKGGGDNPPDNTQLILLNNCNVKFDVLFDGVLRHTTSKACVHPLWGGMIPDEGQKLCLYHDCSDSARLQYTWHLISNSNLFYLFMYSLQIRHILFLNIQAQIMCH